MKSKYAKAFIAALLLGMIVFFSCAEGREEAEHREVLPEEEIREEIVLEIYNTLRRSDTVIDSLEEITDPEEQERVDQIEKNITCIDVDRTVSINFDTVDISILRNFYGSHSGLHTLNFSVGKNFDEWVARSARIYIKNLKVVIKNPLNASYVYLNRMNTSHLIWFFGISGTEVREIGWDGETDLVPHIKESEWTAEELGQFWKGVDIRYNAYGRLPEDNVEVEATLTIFACGDFTNLRHVFYWDI
jgi:hypothetical protein